MDGWMDVRMTFLRFLGRFFRSRKLAISVQGTKVFVTTNTFKHYQ